MGKRYYCDYCDRSFKDESSARKKHLTSLQHIKNRDDHYNLYKDPEIILQEERAKKPCNRFLYKNDCLFGSSCRFSHYSPAMLQHLQNIVNAKSQAKQSSIHMPDNEQTIRFLEESIIIDELKDIDTNLWPPANELGNIEDLPPSLRPISYKEFTTSDFPDWGWK